MRSNLTDITVVLDRSGSMSACKTDAEGGLNHFIQQQKEAPGDALFTLVQFDTVYEFVHRARPIKEVPRCELEPRGMTALLDAVGRAMVETAERLKGMDESQRPGLVVFVIVTDGQENASQELTLAKVKEMIEHQSTVYKWQFTFLGANQDAFAVAGGMGIAAGGALNYAAAKTRQAFVAASAGVRRTRKQAAAGETIDMCYTPEERESAE